MKPYLHPPQARERGAATLVVVMMLFLVMALLAAYANRSLLFEQRISTSYFRASVAQEAAEAGVEWALAELNGTGVDASCKPVASGGQRFADLYLSINAADRAITPASKVDAITKLSNPLVDCARDTVNGGWSCRCSAPTAAHTVREAMPGADLAPSFNVRAVSRARGGTVTLGVLGCTDSIPDRCDGASKTVEVSKNQLARTNLNVQIGLVSAVRTPPAAPLVVKGDVTSKGVGLGLHNSDARSAGQLAIIGGSWPDKVDSRLESVPGTSISQVVAQTDSTLADTNLTADGVFRMFMGASVSRYQLHPSLREVKCDGDCASALDNAYNAGQRILWVNGDLQIASSKVLGSLGDPVLIIATGDVKLTGSFEINGMLVSKGKLDWTNTLATPSVINGIVLVGAGMETNGRMDVVYQQTVADQLRNRMGSYVRIPGGWIDAEK